MTLKKIQLNKLIMLMHADNAQRKHKLRELIRQEIATIDGKKSKGGHFHLPFWSDAKDHVNSLSDLTFSTNQRVHDNKNRERLYPLLKDAFLDWWDNKRRWTNEPSNSRLLSVSGKLVFSDLNTEVVITNLMSLSIGETEKRIIYPYFSETPELSINSAKLTLWAMREALPEQQIHELRVLDILRSKSYSISDVELSGMEEFSFKSKYIALIQEWEELKVEYQKAA